MVAVNVLSYFPGRPLSALFERLKECHSLAAIVARFLNYGDNSEDYAPLESQEVRKHLFNPREVFGAWVRELEELGVPNAEDYAYSKVGWLVMYSAIYS